MLINFSKRREAGKKVTNIRNNKHYNIVKFDKQCYMHHWNIIYSKLIEPTMNYECECH